MNVTRRSPMKVVVQSSSLIFAVLSILSMILIFIAGIQPPNAIALKITLAFLGATAVVWFGFERRRFQGPPIGEEIAKRQAAIRAAEVAVGEKTSA